MTTTAPTLALVFEEADIPVTKRTGTPNPFTEAVQAIIGREKSMTVMLPTIDEKAVKTAVAQLTRAGQLTTPAVSVRKTVTKSGHMTRIVFWTRDLIVHKKDTPAVEPTVEPEPAVKAVPKPPKAK